MTTRRVCALAFALVASAACSEPPVPDFHGVTLGMAPRDVRTRFDVRGKFDVQPGTDDFTMRFSPDAPSSVTSARFEFHTGALVAVRTDVSPTDPIAKGGETLVTKKAVLHRTRTPESVHVDLLSRDCPTHHAEAEELAH